ncbi:MAG: DUF2892 domain-containing protein [Deltaproteobacteria bacterium]|nr:DUF2892 domain-containing protein [Deltaproteobacteria bacterium]
MKKNIGTTDKVIRIIVGVIIIIIGFVFKSWWGIIGILPILTAAIGWCPPYALLGISTFKAEEKDDSPDMESSE